MNFNNFSELVNKINNDLGSFCNVFQYKRKDLNGAGRTAGNNELFGNINEKNRWAINKGGGIEVQYHIEFNEDEEVIYYGLGFNTQYVPFATNTISPVELLKPYMYAFLELEQEINILLPEFTFIYGSKQQLIDPQNEQYTLFGKSISVIENDSDYSIVDTDYNNMLEDLKRQHSVYIKIFELRNKLIKMNSNIVKYEEILKVKPQIILQGPPGTGKTYTAKDIAEQLIFGQITLDKKAQKTRLEKTTQFKLIQFHPAYSYEDFVRGITAKPKGDFVEYKSENKTLGIFASEAQKNYLDSRKDSERLSKERLLYDMFEEFKDLIQTDIDNSGKYSISELAYIYEIDDTSFRYTGDNWSTKFRMPFSEIFKLYNLNIISRKEIKTNLEFLGLTKQHATYFFNLLQAFKRFLDTKSSTVLNEIKVSEKNYVLIIDEINRANLPAVLGELIYALEYRGERVDSMYEVDDDYSLVLPPNLFIIGTMNTADRSVGHIDYAIRRRFAFIDIEPSASVVASVVTVEDDLREKALKLYADVASFFIPEKIASDFKAKDIQLGHSYFLANSLNELSLKLQYEIKPLLKEYIKDGILISFKNEVGIDLTEKAIDDIKII